jgi:DNA-directed RNA polymerase subunit RPC12/RpoP
VSVYAEAEAEKTQTTTKGHAMTVECSQCGKLFKFWEAGVVGWSSREAEDIDCPHCGKVHKRMVTGGHFESEKLTVEEEQAYLADKKKGRT